MTRTMSRYERWASAAALCGGLVIALASCADGGTLSAGKSAGESPPVGSLTASVATVTTFGSGSVGPATSVHPSMTGPAPSTGANGSGNGSGIVYLSGADSGRTIAVGVGTSLELRLAPEGGSYDPPTIDAPTVLREDSHTGGFPGGTDAIARFTAVAPGLAQIRSQTDLACLHTSPACLPPQSEFIVTVRVR